MRWDDRTYGGRVKIYPRALSEDRFFFSSVFWCLAAKAFRGGRNYNRLPSFSFCFFLSLFSRRAFSVIYLLLIDLGRPFVDNTGCY